MPLGFEAPPPAGKVEGMAWGISDAIPLGLGAFHGEAGDATLFGVGVLFGAVTRGSARCATPG